ncbi:hypothetical protein [Diplocloster hominis]|uniref:hypothetical protein n=1 Tax=Diplocloster hominis TaxID=3079010 RepID=UPI0031BB7BAC
MKSKRRTKLIIPAIIAAVLIFFIVVILLVWINREDYQRVIAVNWGIGIPDTCKEIYEKESAAGFHGDNDRYHIFKCNQDQQTTEFTASLHTGNNLQIQEYVQTILKNLEISAENFPPLDQELQWMMYTKNEWDKIAILYVPTQQKLYVIEHFQ